jgi:peptidyl-prolyl cis-trans isomerase C
MRACVLLALSLLVACNKPKAPPPAAMVGGEPISQSLLEPYTELNPALKASLLIQLKQLKAASLLAKADRDKVADEVELKRLEILSARAAKAAGVDEPPTEAELKQAYQEFVAQLPAMEFHVSHILVATENDAALAIVKLQSGVEFGALASRESTDDSKVRGGDLGWISPGKLPTEFTDAIRALKPGEFTAKPIHTNYGWHVIRLHVSRAAAVAAFDQVRPQLEANWQRSQYLKFIEEALQATAEPK